MLARLPHACRRLHQGMARLPTSQPVLSSEYVQAIYQDLMTSIDQPDVVEAPCKIVDSLLADHAIRGDTEQFEAVMSRISLPPTEHQRDLHVKAHLSLTHSQRFPTNALAVLHHYEASGRFAPMKSYTRVISALFNVQTCSLSDPRLGRAAAQAQAWDLFAHMRYVAHPVPDAHLYALMIRACGSFSRPEPERALDLWTEMQENGVEPTKGAYEAIIRVCGRAGPEWLGEGLRLAREMSDRYSITGMSGRGLWCALLEGCKRAGDLKRARWILAEAVRGSSNDATGKDAVVDAELMTHVFHTYASYKTPFKRGTTRLIDRAVASNGDVTANEIQARDNQDLSPTEDSSDVSIENIASMPSFSRLPPQTATDVISETRALFGKIVWDRSLSSEEARNSSRDGSIVGRFAHVELTPVLLNAYLSVFYRHASIETSQEVFDVLFSKRDSSKQTLHPDEHTFINVLEKCAMARAEERHVAARWADDVWRRWVVVEAEGLKEDVGSFARLIERAHAAMRRVLVLSGNIDDALALLRTFVFRYPPNAVRPLTDSHPSSLASPSTKVQLFAKPHVLSTRTVLTNPVSSTPLTARPLVRLTSAVVPKDDRVPPIIAFSDVDLLHARLAEHGRIKELGYIKWVCMAYTNALRKRRDAVLRAEVD